MLALTVLVRAPGGLERRYRFPGGPILVGRTPDCDIAICHEAVPRHLCRAWLEEDGRRVRVEEFPGLTNALERNGRPVKGGVSGARLPLNVGPVELILCGADAEPGVPGRGAGRIGARRALALAAAAVLVVALAVYAATADRSDGAAADALPASLFPADVRAAAEAAAGAGVERAALYASRAEEILGRKSANGAEIVAAVTALRRAASIFDQAGDAAGAQALRRRADATADALDRAWRRDRLALERALTGGDDRATADLARRLLGYLGTERRAARAYLSGLLATSPAAGAKVAP
jgi:hypothetical protein